MEPLLTSFKALGQKVQQLSARSRWAALGGTGALLAVLALAVNVGQGQRPYAYVFTNLTPDDSSEATATLKAAGVPFRLEANGAALSVPEGREHDARMLLAGSGIPRGGHVGFELFDKGDLGVSQFTQKVNLRRAIEGELGRTIAALSNIRTARVHLTLGETSLRRDDDHDASAAVVVGLKPGATLSRRELAGIRHLVSSAVPGLKLDNVSVMDGTGSVLAGAEEWADEAQAFQRKLERELEARVVTLLQPVVGEGGVLARVTVELDTTQSNITAEAFDPESAVLRSERTVSNTSNTTTGGGAARGVAGAAGNQPMAAGTAPGAGGGGGSNGSTNGTEEVRNFEISKTTTVTRRTLPRLVRLSAAVLVDGAGGKPRDPVELTRLTELAKRAVGFDEVRGDRVEVVSNAFVKPEVAAETPAPAVPVWVSAAAGGVLLLLVLGGLVLLARSRRRVPSEQDMPLALLEPGRRVADIEVVAAGAEAAAAAQTTGLTPADMLPEAPEEEDHDAVLVARAQDLVRANPQRAAMLLRAWLAEDLLSETVPTTEQPQEAAHG